MPQPNRRNQIKNNLKGGKNRGRKQARNQQGRNRPSPITAPRDERELRKEAWTSVKPEYAPTLRAAQADRRGSVQRQKNIGQMFQGLQGQIAESATQTDASYNQANAALLAHMNAAQAAAAGSQAQVAQNNVDLTALTGADPSLTTPALAEGAAAANQRNIAGAALAAPIAQAGAAQSPYLRNTGINARREGIQQKTGEMKRRDLIKQDITALRKDRAQRADAKYGELRQGERDYGVQRAAFKLDKQGQALDAQDDAFDNRIAAGNLAVNQQNAATNARNSQQQPDKQGGRTPTQKRDDRKERKAAGDAAWRQIRKAGAPKTPAEWAEFEEILAEEEGIGATAAREAAKRVKAKLRQRQKSNTNVFKDTPGF